MTDDFHDMLRQLRMGGHLDPLQADAAAALNRLFIFVKEIAETSPTAFERGDNPGAIIDDAKELLAGLGAL
jgi:hypothetical protein